MIKPPKEPVCLGPLLSVEEIPDNDGWKNAVKLTAFLIMIGFVAFVAFTTPTHYLNSKTEQDTGVKNASSL